MTDRPEPGATIGPYRVESPIGRGGMGEVYRGHDARLDRPIALKRVRATARDPGRARERFRREARALARVRHPCVVEVYDWIEEADGDWLVMELVEGESLQWRMRRERLPLRRALEIASDVAAGLAAVHAQGIVHRDLKPANIMVIPPEGRIKILDFGLAKRVGPGEGRTLGESVSEAGQILGTVRFMSPEQASGWPVDQRSDLFSLGVLLYEMLTGVAPFRGENTVETLTRICTVPEEPIRDRAPDLPRTLAELVHRLLEKEPEKRVASAVEVVATLESLLRGYDSGVIGSRAMGSGETGSGAASRIGDWAAVSTIGTTIGTDAAPGPASELVESRSAPRRAVAVTVALGVIAVATWWWSLRDREPVEPLYVAVPPVQFSGGEVVPADRRLDASAIEAGVVRALLDLEGAIAVEPSDQDIDLHRPVALARALGTDEVVTSELACDPRACQVVLKRLRGSDGGVAWTGGLTFRDDSLFTISLGVADQVRSAFPELETPSGVSAPRVSPEDYRRFLELVERLVAPEGGGEPAVDLEAEYDAIRASSPEFVELYRFAASSWAQHFDETRREADLDRARQAVAAGRQIAPGDPRILRAAVTVYLVTGDLEAARRDVDALAAREPGDAEVLWLRAHVLLEEGRLEEARATMKEAVARRPSWRYYATLVRIAREMGRLDEARQSVDAMLERAPNNYYTQSLAAEVELLSGNVERATELYEQVVRRRRDSTELTNLGTAYALRGRYREAADLYAEVVEKSPGSVSAQLNLADAEALLGEPNAAQRYRHVLARIEEDPNPEALLSIRAQALARLERPVEAVEAIQAALRRSPDDPAVAFEAAVVYAVVGEKTSALLHARRALDAGVHPVWFDFPWFEGIREHLPTTDGSAGRD